VLSTLQQRTRRFNEWTAADSLKEKINTAIATANPAAQNLQGFSLLAFANAFANTTSGADCSETVDGDTRHGDKAGRNNQKPE
jgi:hypothetical protein